ncbi:hypothetical protein PAHAL_2G440400 [Panicum hallii]|jgi:hypothetical protein|uniref:Uncharacterized protein n=1 Tax=Panicum hallii TaxID=206008 RepID=A0A2T8KSR7_9POAL|nr:hypothetical protein PAHAL_2G440400 [Panicum hallii]
MPHNQSIFHMFNTKDVSHPNMMVKLVRSTSLDGEKPGLLSQAHDMIQYWKLDLHVVVGLSTL